MKYFLNGPLRISDDDMGGSKVSVQRAINQVFDSVETDGEKISLFSSISLSLPQPIAIRLAALLKPPPVPEVASHEDVFRAEEEEKVRRVEEGLLAAKLALERAEAAKLALVGGLKRAHRVNIRKKGYSSDTDFGKCVIPLKHLHC